MNITENLMFFNSEGYPYNFTYTNNMWNGKIFFEPNGTDTFKNLSLYLLEKVDPITYEGNISIVNNELYNESGMTISPYTYSDIDVTKILPVNKSENFYTKWVYGNSINKKFPPSTIVSFNGTITSGVGSTDFTTNKLFTVINTKKNAIMVISETSNDLFDLTNANYNLKINSHRTLSFPEYNSDLNSILNPINNMKLSLIGTEKNDGVYELEKTGNTFSSIYDYDFSLLSSGYTIKLDIEMLTERPLLYNGSVNIYNDNITNEILVNFIDGKTTDLSVGKKFIIENELGEHLYDSYEFTIKSFLDEIKLGTDNIKIEKKTEMDDDGKYNYYTILTYDSNIFDIKETDTIYLNDNIIKKITNKTPIIGNITVINSGVTIYPQTGITTNIVTGITAYYTIIDAIINKEHIHELYSVNSGYNYSNVDLYLNTKLGESSTTDFQYNLIDHYINGVYYTDDNGDIINTGFTFNVFKDETDGKYYTKVIFPITSNINLDDVIYFNRPNFNHKNSNLKRNIVSINKSNSTGTNGQVLYDALLDTNLYTDSTEYSIIKVLKNTQKRISVVDTSLYINTGYTSSVRCLSTSNILSYEHLFINNIDETIDTFVSRYSTQLKQNNIDVYNKNSSLIISGIYSGQNKYFNSTLYINGIEKLSNNTYSDNSGVTSVYNLIVKDKDLTYERNNMSTNLSVSFYADITLNLFDDYQDYGFSLILNNTEYYIPFNNDSGTTSNTSSTIDSFITKWSDVFNKNGLVLSKGNEIDNTSNHLYINGTEPNISITSINVRVNKNSSYDLNIINNKYQMLSYNYLYSNVLDFVEEGFSTGMIISLYGSNYPLNNKEFNIIGLTNNMIELSYQGSMFSDNSYLYIRSREYLRRPRESNIKDIYYNFRWEDDTVDSIFMYDLSGENLIPFGNNKIYEYNGPKPLPLNNDIILLNKEQNKDINYISDPSKQQTIFSELKFKLEKFDDDNATILPKPLSLFLSYNTNEEGVHNRTLIVERYDNVIFSGTTDNNLYFNISNNNISIINSDINRNIDLLDIGFEVNRVVRFKFTDNSKYNKLLFEDWQDFTIIDVTKDKIVVDSKLNPFNTQNKSFEYSIELLPEKIAVFNIYGETESEDERFKSNTSMLGISLTEEDEYIFVDSDIKEHGIDYRLLNRKRKEMLNIYPEIYNYVGSYNSIFKSIYFFGYTDLELYEYYKNIDTNSPLYNSFKRIVVPDLLNRDVEGWSYSEDLSKRVGYRKTNLLNLTYRITDEEGKNVNLYSLSDVQIKLNGLKNWLRKNIIPVNLNIRDITGVSENKGTIWRRFDDVNIIKHKTIENTNSINYNYIASKNFNDSWLVSIRFYNVDDFIPSSFDLKVITYIKDENNKLQPEQYYNVFKTDMLPFNFYMNWGNNISDRFMYVETTYYNNSGVGVKINKMYKLEDGINYIYDEYKNYILINNNFQYKYPNYVQDIQNVYIIDDNNNIYI